MYFFFFRTNKQEIKSRNISFKIYFLHYLLFSQVLHTERSNLQSSGIRRMVRNGVCVQKEKGATTMYARTTFTQVQPDKIKPYLSASPTR